MTDDELKDAVLILRQRGKRAWHQYSLWELIYDIEALLDGRPTEMDRAVIIQEVERALRMTR
jgi:hypothetical protein